MQYNVCGTCCAGDGRAGLLINLSGEGKSNCANCHQTLLNGDYTVYAHLSRTSVELDRMAEALRVQLTSKDEMNVVTEEVVRVLTKGHFYDVGGRTLTIGQKVAMSYKGYTDQLYVGEVMGFTPKKVRVSLKSKYLDAELLLKLPEQLCIIK